MPSPFPGMNPYLEQDDVWHGFHNSFMVQLSQQLQPQLGALYYARISTRQFIHKIPPVSVFPGLPAEDVIRLAFVEIQKLPDRRTVTVIDLLDPVDKTLEQNFENYIERSTALRKDVSFVEIDLRRGGKRPDTRQLPPGDYYVLVSRFSELSRIACWPIGLRNRLPVIPIPLREPDPDVTLDLQDVLHRTYDAAGYGKYIYRETPEPPLHPEAAAWAQQFLPPSD
jgi:hypothetical protein